MVPELHAIHLHLWIITGLLATILIAAGYCNYSRIKEQRAVSPYKYMTDLWECEKFAELRDYTTGYLKVRPNASEVLSYHALISLHFKDYAEARRAAEKLAKSWPQLREQASKLIETVEAEASS